MTRSWRLKAVSGAALVVICAGCSGGQTGDTGTDEARCLLEDTYEVSLDEARQRGFDVDGFIAGALGEAGSFERGIRLLAPVELWLDHDLEPPNDRTTTAILRIAPSGMATITEGRPLEGKADDGQCRDAASAQLRVELELPELDDTLSGLADVRKSDAGDYGKLIPVESMPYLGRSMVNLGNPAVGDLISTYPPDFPETGHGYFGTDRCETIQALPVESSTGLGLLELLNDNLLSGVSMTLECSTGEIEDPVPAPSRELSVTLRLPDEFCPPLGLPTEVAAVASAAIDDRQLDVMNAWIRPTEASCVDSSEQETCPMVTVSLSALRPDAGEGGARVSDIHNGFPNNAAVTGLDQLQLQLQLRDGQRALFATYHELVVEDGDRVRCSGSVLLP
jgi:hypothetical protein